METVDGFKMLSDFSDDDIHKYPHPYDLVLLLLDDGTILPGWHVANSTWDGYRVRKYMNIVGWKRKDYY